MTAQHSTQERGGSRDDGPLLSCPTCEMHGSKHATGCPAASLRAENAAFRAALEKCKELFTEIRGDWSDPRAECREGWAVIDAALAATPAEMELAVLEAARGIAERGPTSFWKRVAEDIGIL